MTDQNRDVRVDRRVVRQLVDMTADRLDAEQQGRERRGDGPLQGMDREMFLTYAFNEAVTEFNRHRLASGVAPLGPEERAGYERAVVAEMWHSGAAIERWLADPSWENLDANGCDEVFVTFIDGRTEQVDPLWRSDQEMLEYIGQMARRGSATTEQRFDPEAYALSFVLPSGHRVSAAYGGSGERGVAPRPLLSIRQHRTQEPLSLDQLQQLGSISPTTCELLRAAVRAKLCLAIVGATDSGKTTLMRALALEVESGERVTTIEDAPELQLRQHGHPNVAALETRKPNSEGRGAVELHELVRLSLRMNPGRVLLGEVLGPADITALLNAMSQGNEGSMCTFHAYSTAEAFGRLMSLCVQPPASLPEHAAGRVIADALDLVVCCAGEKTKTGKRRYVHSVAEVGVWDGNQLTSGSLCDPGPDGVAVPSCQFSDETLIERLRAVGYQHRVIR